jgi:hypothetical protein
MATATPLPISVSGYLHTSYRPDCSPEDRIRRYSERLEDYRRMGERNAWVIDPATRKGFDRSTGSWIEASRVAASPIRTDLAAIFAAIDEDRSR